MGLNLANVLLNWTLRLGQGPCWNLNIGIVYRIGGISELSRTRVIPSKESVKGQRLVILLTLSDEVLFLKYDNVLLIKY